MWLKTIWLSVVPLLVGIVGAGAEETKQPPPAFAQLYDAVMVRQGADGKKYGANELEPLLWHKSRFLLEGETRERFVAAFDAFAKLSDEKIQAHTPVQRALLQRVLWAVFDWSIGKAAKTEGVKHRALQRKLAKLIRRVALSTDAIRALPDTFAATVKAKRYNAEHDPDAPLKPFFPADLFDPKGPWICLHPDSRGAFAEMHGKDLQWRSAFTIFMSLPGGRDATTRYIKELNDFRTPWTTERPSEEKLVMPADRGSRILIFVHPDTPQFPVGTSFALVRRALLIDTERKLVASPLIESIQVRAHLDVDLLNRRHPPFAVAEFHMEPAKLLSGGEADLRSLTRGGGSFGSFDLFLHRGRPDPIEHPKYARHTPRAGIRGCTSCHRGVGIHSVVSRNRLFIPKTLMPPIFRSQAPGLSHNLTIRKKTGVASWGLLQGLWGE
jgi:hypothetical protein